MSGKSVFHKIPAKWRPLLLLGLFALLALLVLNHPPTIDKVIAPRAPSVSVEVKQLETSPYHVVLDSYGVVRPRTQSTLFPQVNGQIVEINPNFREGGFFAAGETLITIDDRDFKAAVTAAEASLLEAERLLLEEQAQGKIAERDWQRSGIQQPAPDLVLRKPQLKAAQAQLKSAQAALQTARLNLERTRIRALYNGRVLSKNVDIGQVVSSNTPLGDIYATDFVEIRLPLKNRDLAFIDLPENYQQSGNDSQSQNDNQLHKVTTAPKVLIQSNLIGRDEWLGHIVRVEGAIDETTQQLHVIAQIEDPYSLENRDKTPLKIGQYVTANISGNTLDNALVIANTTIYQGSYVYVVKDGTVQRRPIEIAWQNDHEALIASGLQAGEQLVTTPLGQVISGTRAQIRNNKELTYKQQ